MLIKQAAYLPSSREDLSRSELLAEKLPYCVFQLMKVFDFEFQISV